MGPTSLRTHIPSLIFMLMDRPGIKLTFSSDENGPLLEWSNGAGSWGRAHLEEGDAYGARAIELERELTLLLVEATPGYRPEE